MPSFLIPIHESNDCHLPAGPGGGQFCGPGYLRGEATRAARLKIGFKADPERDTWLSQFDPSLQSVAVGTGTQLGGPKPKRSEVLSVARHEMGHATNPFYGEKTAQSILGGQKFDLKYTQEFGAWLAAIRDAPNARVNWNVVRQGLFSYLENDSRYSMRTKDRMVAKGVDWGPTTKEWDNFHRVFKREVGKTLDHHIAILKRYARHVRRDYERLKKAVA